MNNIDLEEKTYTTTRRVFPYFSVGLIVVGAVMLIGGAVFYKTSDAAKSYNGNIVSVSEDIDLGKTESVEIDVGAGKLEVRTSSDDSIHIEGDVPKNYVIKESGGILRVDLTKGWKFDLTNFFNFINGSQKVDAVLYLPAKEYKKLDLEVDAGELTVSDIKCKEASFDSGAGEITADGISCTGKVKIDIGAGDITLTDSIAGGLDVDIGAGDFNFDGEVNGDIDVDTGAGDCEIALTNKEEEYNKKYSIKTDTGIGDVKVTFNN